MGLDHGLDWTGGHREPDQSQRDRGRAQGRDSFGTGDRDREHGSRSPPFTSSSSFIIPIVVLPRMATTTTSSWDHNRDAH